MQPEFPDNIDGVNDDQLAAVASTLPTLPNICAKDIDRFAQALRSLAEKRAQNNWPNENEQDVAIFVMVDRPRQIGERYQTQPFIDPIAKDDPLLGYLFFANRDASAGRVMQIPVADPNNILDWLEENGLGACPLVMIYRERKTMVMRRNGVDSLVDNAPIRDDPPPVTEVELLKALEYFHLNRLLTPVCCIKGVWEEGRANEYIPGPKPERKIQLDLGVALNFWFHGIIIAKCEDPTNIGRIDVRLLTKSGQDGPLMYWSIIELKVIKSFANAPMGSQPSTVSPSKNVTAIVDGIRQVWAYQKNRAAEIGLLEIFDLRKEKSTLMNHEKITVAMEECVPEPVYHIRSIFGRSKDARNAGFSGN